MSEPLHSAEDELALVVEAAGEAADVAMGYFRRDPEVWWKDGHSPVSRADLEVNRVLHARLTAARPGYGWLSEESADAPERLAAPRTFVVDPIDGTRAFIAGYKVWCVSIAVVEDGRALAGVLACPASDEVYCAARGTGARLNGQPIAVRQPQAALALGGSRTMMKALPAELYERVRPYTYVPSLAYRVALVARGALDGTFVKPFSHDWDLAAADVILEEAGGSIVDAEGNRPSYAGRNTRLGPLAVGSGSLLEAMSGALSDIRA